MFGKPVREKNFQDTVEAFGLLGYKCDVNTGDKMVRAQVMGDDLPILIIAKVDEGFITFVCKLAFEATQDSYRDAVWNLNAINDTLQFGAFILDTETGWLSFHYSVICGDNRMGKELIAQIVSMVITTVGREGRRPEEDPRLQRGEVQGRHVPVNTRMNPIHNGIRAFFIIFERTCAHEVHHIR